MGGALVGVGLAQQFLDLLPRQAGLPQDAADGAGADDLTEDAEDPLFEFLHRPQVAWQTMVGRLAVLDDINDLFYLIAVNRGAAATAASVTQGVGSVFVVAMKPEKDRLVVAADVSSTGGGVELTGGDQIQGLKAFPGALMRRVQAGSTQIFHGLTPFAHLHTDHTHLRRGSLSRRSRRLSYPYARKRKLRVST